MKKPEKVLTVIRTGTGDQGTTWFRDNHKYPKSSLQIEYLGMLDLVQSHTVNCDIQDLIFALGANFYNQKDEKYLNQITQLTEFFEKKVKDITSSFNSLDGFIRTTSKNQELMKLRAVIRQTEQLACQLLELEPCIKLHVKSLNILSDYVFTLAWKNSLNEYNQKVHTWSGNLSDTTLFYIGRV